MRKLAPALAADIVLVLIFVAIGRRSHDESGALAGLAQTAWPFLLGLAAGWLAILRTRDPFPIVPAGVTVWVSTVLIGMLLRAATHAGTAVSFIIVASATLAVFLLGWRTLYRLAGARLRT